MGTQGPGRRPLAELRTGYDAAADDWDAGPGPVYEALARGLVAAAPVSLTGRVILDLGAGTGAAGRAAIAAGARQVVAADLSMAMLRRHSFKARGVTGSAACYPVAADAAALPFRDGCFDLVLAAFCLNHLSRLDTGLAELRRVGAALAASTFAPGWTHPAKDAVDQAARSFGYRPPPWYQALAPGERASEPQQLAACATAAGFTHVRVNPTTVPTPVATPAALAAWRLGMAHYAPFLHALGAQARIALWRAAEQAVAASGAMAPLAVEMTVLSARSPGR